MSFDDLLESVNVVFISCYVGANDRLCFYSDSVIFLYIDISFILYAFLHQRFQCWFYIMTTVNSSAKTVDEYIYLYLYK